MRSSAFAEIPNVKRRIPFKIDRTDRRGLVVQLAEGLKRSIADGVFKPGDVLPTWREMSEELGVSLRIPREAMARLVSAGVLSSCPRRGTVVLSRTAGGGKRVVIAVAEQQSVSFYTATLIARIRSFLTRRGYRVDVVACEHDQNGADDVRPIEAALESRCELLVSMVENKTAWKRISTWKLPPVLFLGDVPRKRMRGCGRIVIDNNRAVGDFVRHCQERGIRRVVEIGMGGGGSQSAFRLLRRAGIETERLVVRVYPNEWLLSATIRRAMEITGEYVRAHRRGLPELLLLDDDFIANGALVALLDAGVKVPRDIRVVTFANKGFGPVFPVGLTRLEMNAVSDGDFVAESILAFLREKVLPDGVVLGTTYFKGESFW